jgi:FPC/CPF motif-containing protein YcgG
MKRDSMAAFAAKTHAAFRELVLDPEFSCLGAKAAMNEESYGFAVFSEMGTKDATRALSRELVRFTHSVTLKEKEFSTFVAVFRGPLNLTEREFETCLWLQLRELHRVDRAGWDRQVSSDPADPHFSFSFAGQAFYVIGMHANSSRATRRFPWPTLVFNPHKQFERLRTEGKWRRMQNAIRGREIALQGNINPMVNDFGDQSEARQYSGRAVPDKWAAPFPSRGKCPFAH